MPAIDENAARILRALVERPREPSLVPGEELATVTGLGPDDVNDAVTVLVEAGQVRWLREIGTAPFIFSVVELTPRGRREYERLTESLSMLNMIRDVVTLRKPDGRVIPNIRAHVQSDLVVVPDGTLPLEEQDILTRVLPNGLEERYIVVDRGFHPRGIGGLRAHYQAKVRRESSGAPTPAPAVIYNLHGNSRINIGSQDASTNVINTTTNELFDSLRQAVERGISDNQERARILDHIERLERTKGTATYTAQYVEFIGAVADHMTLLAPFIPALTQLFQQFMSR